MFELVTLPIYAIVALILIGVMWGFLMGYTYPFGREK